MVRPQTTEDTTVQPQIMLCYAFIAMHSLLCIHASPIKNSKIALTQYTCLYFDRHSSCVHLTFSNYINLIIDYLLSVMGRTNPQTSELRENPAFKKEG